jgi:hypothetical protein
MRMTRDFWNDIEKFLDTASDRQLTEAKAAVFDLLSKPMDRSNRADIKAVYRLVLDEIRIRERLAQRAMPTTELALTA